MRMIKVAALAIAITSGSVVASADEGRVEDHIEARFHEDARLKGDHIKVDVDNGVATLKGKVATEADKARAERLARVAGVSRVENKLDVDASVAKDRLEDNARAEKKRIDERADREKARVDQREDRAKARLDAEAKGAPVTETRKSDSTGDEITDSWITTKVKTQYVGVDALKGSDITVDTNHDGVVTLTGSVPNEAARTRAVEIARTTKGVRRVVDSLRIR